MDDKYKNLPPRFPAPVPDGAVFGPDGADLDYQPKWKIPDVVGIACHVTGQPIKRAKNPAQPYTPDEIRQSALDCIEAGASCVHIHARTDKGNFVNDKKEHLQMLRDIIVPVREKYGNSVYVDGCVLVDLNFETEKILIDAMLDEGLMDSMPLNPGTITPPRLLQAEAAYLMEKGSKPALGLHEDEAIDQGIDFGGESLQALAGNRPREPVEDAGHDRFAGADGEQDRGSLRLINPLGDDLAGLEPAQEPKVIGDLVRGCAV